MLKVVILITASILQWHSLPALAAGSCMTDKSDIREDTKIINQKLTVRYGFSPVTDALKRFDPKFKSNQFNENIERIYDDQELKVDRSLPFLNQVNVAGIVTNGPAENPLSYGTAVLISPCHVLINAHAIVDEKTKNGESPILVSLGQNACDSKNEFLHQDIEGRVIASGNPDDPSKDYAIVKVPLILDITPAIISTEYLSRSLPLITVGFPFKSTYSQKSRFRYPTASFMRANGLGVDGSFEVTNVSNSAGGSGSGIFILDEDNGRPQVVLAGIHRGQKGVGIQTAAILKLLKKDYEPLYKSLADAIRTKTCE